MFFTAGKTTPNPIPWIPTASHCTLTLGINISFEKLNTVFSWMHIHNEHPDFPNGLNSAWSLDTTKTSRIWNTHCSHCHNPIKEPNQQTSRLPLTTRLFCYVMFHQIYPQCFLTLVLSTLRDCRSNHVCSCCSCVCYPSVKTDTRTRTLVSLSTLQPNPVQSHLACHTAFCPSSFYRFKKTKNKKEPKNGLNGFCTYHLIQLTHLNERVCVLVFDADTKRPRHAMVP